MLHPKAVLTNFAHRIGYIHHNVLGMNRRNSELIFRHNSLKYFQLADNKILTKRALIEHNIPTPTLHFTITTYFELKQLKERLAPLTSFVIKPANGFGGEGVLIVNNAKENCYEIPGGSVLNLKQINNHIQDTLAGVYSLSQLPDHVLCEEKIKSDPVITALTYKGIPDIRIVVFQGVPVMAMLRLSTKISLGKANLHQGGIGVGIDLKSGRTSHAIFLEKFITHHPDSGVPLTNVQIPNWQNILELAARSFAAVPLGYMGVDIVIDPTRGPMVLELNVRPGLMIQMANRMGLRPILESVREDAIATLSLAERVMLGQDLYEQCHQQTHE